MAIDSELINLKSAGTYRFERDNSEISNDNVTVSNLRLVVGFSKTGPFNTVKLVTSAAQFIKLYGNIDRSLEKKGSFFHRSALVALSAGPILCMNILNPDSDEDQVMEKSFSVNCNEKNSNTISIPLQALYNTDKFWFTSDEAYLDGIDKILGTAKIENNAGDSGSAWSGSDYETSVEGEYNEKILHFTNVGKKPVSILIKKASEYSSKGYELTLNEWYGEGNVPEYLNGTSYVSDYLVEVYVVGGDFGPETCANKVYGGIDLDGDNSEGHTDYLTFYRNAAKTSYKRFSSDVNYQNYFDDNGFIRGNNDSNLTRFLNLSSVDFRAKYVGSLIPNFTDKLGRNIWIQKIVNDDTDTTGILCVENVDLVETVEYTGDFIDEKIDLVGHGIASKIMKNLKDDGNKVIPSIDFDFLSYKFSSNGETQVVKIMYGAESKSFKRVPYSNNDDTEKNNDKKQLYPFAWREFDNDENKFVDGGKILYAASTYLSKGSKLYESSSEKFKPFEVVDIIKDIVPTAVEYKIKKSSDNSIDEWEIDDDKPTKKTFKIDYDLKDNEVILDKYADVVVGDYLVMSCESSNVTETDKDYTPKTRLTRVIGVKNIVGTYDNNETITYHVVSCRDKIYTSATAIDDTIVKVNPVDKIADHYQWIALNGFKVRSAIMPDGTNERQNEILDVLRQEPEYTSTVSNLYNALIDRDYVQWRYIVDTFGLGIEESCKDVYTKLCQGRKSGFAIVNCPSQMDFKKSLDPSFTNKLGGVEAEYVAKGGDLSKNPSFLFSLPNNDNGGSWGAYYYPYLRITDLSAAKSVPPAAYVSNLYIQKYSKGFPWSIVAGQKRGVISGNQVVGVESTLIRENRDWLEPVGINSIIWEPGVGVEIYANKTAKQTPVSALSSAHVREAAIYIQDGVESILKRYVFEFNTAQTRLEIKTLVDDFLNTMKNNGGLYDFKTVMDTTNNTSEIIDRNMGVIDIYVEIVRGLEIIAQRLTILKTGAISTGGFE